MKKAISIISVLAIVISLFSGTALAYETTDNNQAASPFFISFINNCFSDGNEIAVTDANGNDVTKTVYEDLYEAYNNDNFSYIFNYMLEKNLEISRTWTVADSKDTSGNALGTDSILRAPTEHKTVSQEFYNSGYDKTYGRFMKEWTTTITGTFFYNANTYAIIDSLVPTVSMDSPGWGTFFSPYMENASAWYRISSNKATITYCARYQLKCLLSVGLSGIPAQSTLDYGSIYHSFTATA